MTELKRVKPPKPTRLQRRLFMKMQLKALKRSERKPVDPVSTGYRCPKCFKNYPTPEQRRACKDGHREPPAAL